MTFQKDYLSDFLFARAKHNLGSASFLYWSGWTGWEGREISSAETSKLQATTQAGLGTYGLWYLFVSHSCLIGHKEDEPEIPEIFPLKQRMQKNCCITDWSKSRSLHLSLWSSQ